MIEILTVDEKTVRARLQGSVTDPNFYDGSKPPTQVEVVATFTSHRTLRHELG